MPYGVAYWVVILIWFIFMIWDWRQGWGNWWANGVFALILFIIIGLHSFGPALR